MSFLDRFRKLTESVAKTQEGFFGRVADLFDRRTIDDDLYDELEETLIQADVGVDTTVKLVERLRERVRRDRIREAHEAKTALREEMIAMLKVEGWDEGLLVPDDEPSIILVVGVNGTGKTTSIAKLAKWIKESDLSVAMAAADTFRAAAIDQLKIWGERVDVPVIAHQPNADPGAVVYDGVQYALNRNLRVLVVDTAGRLHTKFNLMEELKKIRRVIQRHLPNGPHEVLLVLDATTGQNALQQAKAFTEAVEVTGIILSKLDGTARGGMAFAITQELGIPIKFAGTGEKADDLSEFDPETFVKALLP